jgi:tripartite-type tricarboxylate transporter receptor subunit TctC
MRACIEAPPDGHTLCSLSGDNIVLPEFLVKTLDFDLRGGVRPIAHLFYNPQMLVVSATLGARTLDEVAAAGKKRPGTFAYTSPSLTSQLFMEWFDRKHRLDAVSVPFRGGSDALGNLLSGSIQFLFTGAANFAPFIADGKIHPLVVDSPLRLSQYPDVPTLREAGFGGPLVRNYLGLMAPAKTPDALARLINARVNEIMNDPTFRQRHLIDRGLEPANGTIEDFAAYIASDRVASKQAVTDANLAPQ